MIFSFFLNKLKSLVFVIISIFRRALVCIKRRHSKCEVIPLTHVVSNTEHSSNWEEWEEENSSQEPKTVQDHINLYRKQKFQLVSDPEEQLNFFEDMTPHITKQTKILLNKDFSNGIHSQSTNRLNILEDTVNILFCFFYKVKIYGFQILPELVEWEDNSGWEGENDAQKLLRETKKIEREQRALQKQQKRHENKINRSLGSKMK